MRKSLLLLFCLNGTVQADPLLTISRVTAHDSLSRLLSEGYTPRDRKRGIPFGVMIKLFSVTIEAIDYDAVVTGSTRRSCGDPAGIAKYPRAVGDQFSQHFMLV